MRGVSCLEPVFTHMPRDALSTSDIFSVMTLIPLSSMLFLILDIISPSYRPRALKEIPGRLCIKLNRELFANIRKALP